MSDFVPNKQHSREALLFCFNLKKNAAEARRLLQEAYGEHAPSKTTCEYWFKRFRSGDFDTKDKERHRSLSLVSSENRRHLRTSICKRYWMKMIRKHRINSQKH